MESQKKPTRKRRRSPLRRTGAFISIQPEIYAQMRERAAQEGLSYSVWLKRCALKELKRPLSL